MNPLIKKQFSVMTSTKVVHKLMELVRNDLELEENHLEALCLEVVTQATKDMGNQYTAMGGYSEVDQLFARSQKLIYELDEQGKLAELIEVVKIPF